MKTKVRIQRNDGSPYSHLHFQVLTQKSYATDYYEIAFTISWQSGGHAKDEKPYWYAFNYEVNTDRAEHLKTAHQVASYIQKRCGYNERDPQNIFKVLKAEEYVYIDGHFVPVSMDGCNKYRLEKSGSNYAAIFARSEEDAWTKANEQFSLSSYQPEDRHEIWKLHLVQENIPIHSVNYSLE